MLDKGSILLHVEAKHVVLLDINEKFVDARYLKEGESINPGSVFNFACHKVDIGERILQPGAYIEDASVVTPNQVTIPQLSSAVEPQLTPKQEDAEERNGRLLGNVDELDVNKENDPPSKRTKQKKKDAKKRKTRKDEEIGKESNEEDPLLPRGDQKTNLPVNTEDPHLLSGSIETHMPVDAEEQEDDLLNGAGERGVDYEKEPPKRCQTKQDMRDEKKRKRLKAIKKIKKETQPGVKLVRSPLAMFGAVASLRKEISPQAKRRKSTPLVRTPLTSLMASTSNASASSLGVNHMLSQPSPKSIAVKRSSSTLSQTPRGISQILWTASVKLLSRRTPRWQFSIQAPLGYMD